MKNQHGLNKEPLFPLGIKGPEAYFTGDVYVQMLVDPSQIGNLYSVGQVSFEPKARTHWHTHPIGQVLLVTEGNGWYQEKGKPAQPLVRGTVVVIPKDVKHWHGASRDSQMVHIAISNMKDGTPVTWLEAVTNQEYDSI